MVYATVVYKRAQELLQYRLVDEEQPNDWPCAFTSFLRTNESYLRYMKSNATSFDYQYLV